MKIKSIYMILVFTLSFILTACGNQGEEVSLSGTESTSFFEKENHSSTTQEEQSVMEKEDDAQNQNAGSQNDTVQIPMGTGMIDSSAFSGKVTGCYYADGEKIIIAADKLYLYDTQNGKNIASVDIFLEELNVQTFSKGYFIVGRVSRNSGSSFMSADSNGIKAYLLDEDFNIEDTISFNGLIDNDFVLSTVGISVSDDGTQIAFCGMQGLYLYDMSSQKVSTVLNYSENAVANNMRILVIDSITFISNKSLVYTGSGINIGDSGNGFSIYGTVSVDNATLSITKNASYEVAELQKGGNLLVMPQSFNKNNGTLLMFDAASSTEQFMKFESDSEGKDGVFCSQNGNYVATASLSDTSVNIKIYDTVSGKVIHTEKVENSNSTYFLRIPQILVLDDSKTCIVILGRGIDEVDTLTTTFGFEG